MSATISYEWIPRLQRGSVSEEIKQQTNLSDLACSVSAGSALTSKDSEDSQDSDVSHVSVPKDLLHTPTDSKKVDYVLVLELLDAPLKRIISDLAKKATVDRRGYHRQDAPPSHVNQTIYRPIKDSLIAVSIETKQDSSGTDPLL